MRSSFGASAFDAMPLNITRWDYWAGQCLSGFFAGVPVPYESGPLSTEDRIELEKVVQLCGAVATMMELERVKWEEDLKLLGELK